MTVFAKEFIEKPEVKFHVFKGRKLVFGGTEAYEVITLAMPLVWVGGSKVTIKRIDGSIFFDFGKWKE